MLEQPSLMTPRDRLTAIRLGNAMAPLVRLKPNMRLPMAGMFLCVAKEDGLTVSELARRIGVRKTVASRYLSDLGLVDRHGKPGLGLVMMSQRVYGDRRERHVHLTARGLEMVRQMYVAVTEARPKKRF